METSTDSHIDKESDDIYLRIWEIEQRHTTTRWTVATFFFGISFALFGLSYQVEKISVPRVIPQLLAVAIYWFAYLVFRQFNAFSRFLRQYLKEMETSKKTSLNLQSASQTFMSKNKTLSATHLLLYFGIVYSAAAILLGYFYR